MVVGTQVSGRIEEIVDFNSEVKSGQLIALIALSVSEAERKLRRNRELFSKNLIARSEVDIGNIKNGQKVTFRIDAFPDEEFTGKVSQVRIAPETSDNVVTYTVAVNNPEQRLMPGMTANDALRLPVTSWRFTPSEELF